jgi:hypothetical protein
MTSAAGTTRSLFLPLLLVAASVVAMAGFQTYQLLLQQSNLDTVSADQEGAMEEAREVRAQLQSIARGTADLAASGNQNAKLLIDELARQGIRVTANGVLPSTQ